MVFGGILCIVGDVRGLFVRPFAETGAHYSLKRDDLP